MAYTKLNLQPIGGQGKAGTAPQMFSYTAPGTDDLAAMNTSGYFDGASDILKVGDLIYAWDSSVPTATLFVVRSNASGVVDVFDGTALSVANAD